MPAKEEAAVVTRITNSIISRQVARNLQLNMRRLSRLQTQLSSTKQFSRPSDNPVDYTQALNLREVLMSERRFVRNIQNAINVLNLNDTTLSAVNDVVQRARELALAGSNDGKDQGCRCYAHHDADAHLAKIPDLAIDILQVKGADPFADYPFKTICDGV